MIDIFKTTTEESREQIVLREVESIAVDNSSTLNMLKERFKSSFEKVWANPIASPQDIFDGFGVNAYKLFQVANETAQFIMILDSEWTPPTPPYQ